MDPETTRPTELRVLGFPLEREDAGEMATFLTRTENPGHGLSESLLDDLARLTVVRWSSLGLDASRADRLRDKVADDPLIVSRLLAASAGRVAFDTRLIEEREGLPAGDLRAAVAAEIMSALTHAAAEAALRADDAGAFADYLAARIDAARELFRAPREGSAHE